MSVRETIENARAAGHDALGVRNDPEALRIMERLLRKRLKQDAKGWIAVVRMYLTALLKASRR